jgi:hypothetical protein
MNYVTAPMTPHNTAGDYGASMDVATATVNLAHDPSLAAVVERLSTALRDQFNNDHLPPM